MPPEKSRLSAADAFGEPPRTGRFWFDLLAASAAIFISVVSLAVAIRGEHTQRGLLAAASWPFVQLSKDVGLDDAKLDVENAGVGPAKIINFAVFYQGKPMDNAVALLESCCGLPATATGIKAQTINGLGSGQVYGNVVRPGEHVLAIKLSKTPTSQAMLDRFVAAFPQITFNACYCSVLGECWTSDLRTLDQVPVESCPINPHQFSVGDEAPQ